jgi:hypothetical protein
MRFLYCVLDFLIFSPLPLSVFALNLPHRLVAVADDLSGMVHIKFPPPSLLVCMAISP